MKRQFPGNANNQRCDPRFSGGRGRGRGPMNSPGGFGSGRGGPYRVGGLPPMNGGRGGGPMNGFPPGGRGPPPKFFGRGRPGIGHHQPYHRNQMHPPPPSQHINHKTHGPPGPPPMRGGPPSGMMGRGRMNMGHNSFTGGRGRGRNNMPGRNPYGGRGNVQQQRSPPQPFRGGGPPPPPVPRLPHPSTMNGISQPFKQQMSPQSQPYGVAPGSLGSNQPQQARNEFQHQPQHYQLQSQQPGPPTALPYQQSQALGYQQVSNPAHQTQNQRLLPLANTAQYQKSLKQQPASHISPSRDSSASAMVIPSAQKVEDGWKEYTAPGGIKYYYNELSKESTYEKPDALKKLGQTNGTSSTTEALTASSSLKSIWHEHEDASTGRKYYSDGVTTTWEKPDGFVSPETIVANTSSGLKREEQISHEGPTSKKKKRSHVMASVTSGDGANVDTFASKKEAVKAFKGLLLDKGTTPTLKWNEVMKLCESDSRWDSFEEVLSMGERRQALAEYQTKRSNEIRNEQRQERIRAKKLFGELLADILPSVPGFSARTSRFAEVRDALSKDDRFFAVEEEEDRETLFFDFCDDFKKRDERNKRNKKREIQKSFVSFLEEKTEKGALRFTSTLESFLLTLSDEDKKDSRFATSHEFTESERQLYFSDFIIELQKAEDDKRRRVQDERRRAEKAQRDNYRELLHALAVKGKILPYSRWREIEEFVIPDDSFKLVEEQDRGTPRALFEIFVDDWDEAYRRDRSFLLRLLRPPGKPDIAISSGTTFDSFKKKLIEEAAYSSEIQDETSRIIGRADPVSSARILFDELIAQSAGAKRHGGPRRGSTNDDSSEDEGEIIEDGEITDDDPNGDTDKQ
mmetsp:Transcript_24319/g.67324  ORF Transcript_24319/g.67324 Transcript_24319/m.67324 type:complete len:856 (-) Transcript_24319:222-2789(-)|eukprot:CAMPEP_0172373080 /NCGR_PEP_ID=MMETSP1060-20121228/50263_1 /TAXON_ID=37318 /ORGANISM="Pseudo-nitzschia pungens, Strain cf. cingulata" /LENGTH=855 /DNA_ID=CAMNT_0013099291 /DNA_START=172 /DNA_END=2739 /DNA_ORIENTATION=-